MRYKIISVILMLCFVLLSPAAYATGAWYQFGDGNPVMQGGINKLGGVECESKEDSIALEARLRAKGYILATTDDKDISDEDFETLTEVNYQPPYYQYFDRNSEFGWDMRMYKVYLYKASLDDALEQLRTEGRVRDTTKVELSTSTVVVDYAAWFFKERIGKVLNEINDNIPSWYTDVGFLEIQSPIDAKVTLELWSEHTYTVLYVKAGEPLLVKMKEGMHVVRDINYVGIDVKEDTIKPFNNLVVRADTNTIDNPKIMSLEGVVTKYEIPSLDITNKPDFNWGNKDNLDKTDYDIPVESVVIGEPAAIEEPVTEAPKSNLVLIIVTVTLIGGLLIWVLIKMKKEVDDDDE